MSAIRADCCSRKLAAAVDFVGRNALITSLPQSGHKVEERFLSIFRPNPLSFVIRDRVEATTDKDGKRKAEGTDLRDSLRGDTDAEVATACVLFEVGRAA